MSNDYRNRDKGKRGQNAQSGDEPFDPATDAPEQEEPKLAKMSMPELLAMHNRGEITDDQLIQLSRVGILETARVTVENLGVIDTPRKAEVQMNIWKEIGAMGLQSKKLAQEADGAGMVKDAVGMLHGLFTTVRNDTVTPVRSNEAVREVSDSDVDVGDIPDEFIARPGQMETGTHNMNPDDFLGDDEDDDFPDPSRLG